MVNYADSPVAIDTFQEFDVFESSSESQGGIQHWFDNYFLVWGYQKINNAQYNQSDEKRNIFFINKLLIE